MIKQFGSAISGMLRTVVTVGMVVGFFWLIGAVDGKTLAHAGQTHAATLRKLIQGIPWNELVAVGLLVVLAVVVAMSWGVLRRAYMRRRPVKVSLRK